MTATRTERAEQTDDEPERAFREPNDRFSGLPWDESEIQADLQVTQQLRSRAERYAQASDELRGRAQGVAFNHVGRDGRRGSPDLIGQSEVPTERFLKRQRIGRAGQSLTALPRFQCFELFHNSQDGRPTGNLGYQIRAVLGQIAAPTIPHSPVPVGM